MRTVLGMDGCRAGWLYVARDLDTGACRAGILAHIDALESFDPFPQAVGIDIPMGLPDFGPRVCDQEARKILGRPRSSSVFPAPIRAVLDAASHGQACALGAGIDGRGISIQAWGIVPKIREVDAFLRSNRRRRESIFEVHPEVSFLFWNHGRPLSGKKTPRGRAERLKLVAAGDLGLPRGGWAEDDLLDACAALWSAERILAGSAIALPSERPRDRYGIRMQIAY